MGTSVLCTTTTDLWVSAIQFVVEDAQGHTLATVTTAAQTRSGSMDTVSAMRAGTDMTAPCSTATELPRTTVVSAMEPVTDTATAQMLVTARHVPHTLILTTGDTVPVMMASMAMTVLATAFTSTQLTPATARTPVTEAATAQRTTIVWDV
jgi:hypothetical protein